MVKVGDDADARGGDARNAIEHGVKERVVMTRKIQRDGGHERQDHPRQARDHQRLLAVQAPGLDAQETQRRPDDER